MTSKLCVWSTQCMLLNSTAAEAAARKSSILTKRFPWASFLSTLLSYKVMTLIRCGQLIDNRSAMNLTRFIFLPNAGITISGTKILCDGKWWEWTKRDAWRWNFTGCSWVSFVYTVCHTVGNVTLNVRLNCDVNIIVTQRDYTPTVDDVTYFDMAKLKLSQFHSVPSLSYTSCKFF